MIKIIVEELIKRTHNDINENNIIIKKKDTKDLKLVDDNYKNLDVYYIKTNDNIYKISQHIFILTTINDTYEYICGSYKGKNLRFVTDELLFL